MLPYDDDANRGEDELPFGAMELPPPASGHPDKNGSSAGVQPGAAGKRDWRRAENRRGRARRGGRQRRRFEERQAGQPGGAEAAAQGAPGSLADSQGEADGARGGAETERGERGGARERFRTRFAERPTERTTERTGERAGERDWSVPRERDQADRNRADGDRADRDAAPGESRLGRRRRRGRRGLRGAGEHAASSGDVGGQGVARGETAPQPLRDAYDGDRRAPAPESVVEGMFVLEKTGNGVLRRLENQFTPGKNDIWVPQRLAVKHKLRDGALVSGPIVRGQGQYKLALAEVRSIDGRDPREANVVTPFKNLTSIDPDFHYAVGDIEDDVSMRVMDVICPVGRGTRGLIVAPPRSGKTILMRKFASAIEKGYPDVKLMVLLVDERPEEATEWKRSTSGQVFVSTNDEGAKNHVMLAEAVWKRCQRLVELGDDVVLLLDSITRLARAYNNLDGGSGRTMSGGLDSRAMERPRAFFGAARNTEKAGSLTILGTTLVETGSRLDQLVFEEFKGTGNMECVLSRKLADRRIFPAIDVEKSGTRKEEKLFSSRKLKQIGTLRRVLLKMNFIEAMELLINKLENVEKTEDFLKRFDVDPEA